MLRTEGYNAKMFVNDGRWLDVCVKAKLYLEDIDHSLVSRRRR